jgi:hypothetical protein
MVTLPAVLGSIDVRQTSFWNDVKGGRIKPPPDAK